MIDLKITELQNKIEKILEENNKLNNICNERIDENTELRAENKKLRKEIVQLKNKIKIDNEEYQIEIGKISTENILITKNYNEIKINFNNIIKKINEKEDEQNKNYVLFNENEDQKQIISHLMEENKIFHDLFSEKNQQIFIKTKELEQKNSKIIDLESKIIELQQINKIISHKNKLTDLYN